MIVQSLDRSMSELFRMILVLEYRGFIEQAPNGKGYKPSDKLFSLGMEQAPNKNMLEIALPVMRELSNKIGQSCHLAVRSRGDIVVVARMESGEQIGFTVRIGWRRSLALTRSGAVLLAYQQDSVKKQWIASLSPEVTKAQIVDFRARAELVRARGYDRAKSEFVTGVTDLSAPILRGETAAAALTVPFVHATQLVMPIDETLQHLRTAATKISVSLLRTDHRV
jgi:DNA-binding IclR family transcriptional regulator